MLGKIKLIFTIFLVVFGTLFFHAKAGRAEGYQICQPGVDCVIGEFVFDDTYIPITIDVCTINVKDSDGSTVASDVHTTFGATDGWHSYTFNGTTPEGLYRAIICCDFAAEKACKDKSFMLQTPVTGSDPNAATQTDIDNAKSEILAGISGSTANINSNVNTQTANLIVGSNPNAVTKADLSSAKSDINANVDAAESGIKSKIKSTEKTLKSKINSVGSKVSGLWKKILSIFGR